MQKELKIAKIKVSNNDANLQRVCCMPGIYVKKEWCWEILWKIILISAIETWDTFT